MHEKVEEAFTIVTYEGLCPPWQVRQGVLDVNRPVQSIMSTEVLVGLVGSICKVRETTLS